MYLDYHQIHLTDPAETVSYFYLITGVPKRVLFNQNRRTKLNTGVSVRILPVTSAIN